MKIGIDLRTAFGKKTGKGWYTFHLVRKLLAIDHTNEYILYADTISGDIARMFSGAAKANIKLTAAHPLLWHFAVIKDFTKNGGEIFFAPTSFIIPAFLPKKIKSVITVHDLVAFLHPHLHQAKATILEHLFFRWAIKKASHVLVPSKNTKRDLVTLYRYPPEKVTVTPLASDEIFLREPQNLAVVKEKFGLPNDFVLTVSGLEPRKNVGRLMEAFGLLRKKYPALSLIIVGGKGWKSKTLQEKIRGQKENIRHIENCESEFLPALYRLAKIFVFPSLYEGFGLPPLEAMASGTPVICSKTSSLPEVCGNAALYIDPENVEDIVRTLDQLLKDKQLHESLRKKGLAQAQKFSWRKTAEATLKVLNS